MPVSLSRIVVVVSLVSWTHPCAYVDAAVSVVLVTSVEGSSGRGSSKPLEKALPGCKLPTLATK